jgi:hypothetical protein
MSLVFQNINPTPLSAWRECPPPPPQQRRGVHTRRAEREVGINILEDERRMIALLQL